MTLICLCTLLVFNAWHFEYIPNAMDDLMLAVDDEGMAHVVSFAGGTIIYAMRTAAGDSFVWSTEVVATGAIQPYAWYGTSVEIAVDGNSNPHITYCKEGYDPYSPALCYACKDSSGTWNSTVLDTSCLKIGIACDSLNHPHIVYTRNAPVGWDGIWHKYWDGSAWVTEYVVNDAGYISLVIDNKDQLHYSMGAPLLDDQRQFYHYGLKDSTGWHFEHMGSYDARWPIGIAIDTDNNPHLCVEVYPYDQFYVKKQNGTWIGEDITYLDFRFSTCITVIDDIPHLLGWYPYYPYDTYHVWKSDSTTWSTEDIHTGVPQSMTSDEDGYIHCIIIEGYQPVYGTNRPQPGIEQARSENIATFPMPTIARFPLNISLLPTASFDELVIYDITGRAVKNYRSLDDHGSKHSISWDGTDDRGRQVEAGIYFITYQDGDQRFCRKVIIAR